MIATIIAIFIMILIMSACSAERDRIMTGKSTLLNNYPWWTEMNVDESGWDRFDKFIFKYIFSFLYNGWHFCKSIEVFVMANLIGYLTSSIWLPAIIYIVFGMIFNWFYHRQNTNIKTKKSPN